MWLSIIKIHSLISKNLTIKEQVFSCLFVFWGGEGGGGKGVGRWEGRCFTFLVQCSIYWDDLHACRGLQFAKALML